MSVAEATPDLEHVDRHDRAFMGHPTGLGFLGFTEACERFSYYSMQTLLVLYMVNYLLVPGRMDKVIGLNWLQMHVYHGISRSAARIGDLRHLHVARLPHPDPRRDDRRQMARPGSDADRRRSADGARPLPDGDRARLPVLRFSR